MIHYLGPSRVRSFRAGCVAEKVCTRLGPGAHQGESNERTTDSEARFDVGPDAAVDAPTDARAVGDATFDAATFDAAEADTRPTVDMGSVDTRIEAGKGTGDAAVDADSDQGIIDSFVGPQDAGSPDVNAACLVWSGWRCIDDTTEGTATCAGYEIDCERPSGFCFCRSVRSCGPISGSTACQMARNAALAGCCW
jgi:hypothetical protein